MMNYIKSISLLIVLSAIIVGLSKLLDSNFILDFLDDDLISILITVFAINTATNSLLIADLANIAKSTDLKFKQSYEQIKFSIYEQLILIVLGFLLLMIRGSQINFESEILFILDTLLVCVFAFSIDILRDTAMAVFKLIEFRNHNPLT